MKTVLHLVSPITFPPLPSARLAVTSAALDTKTQLQFAYMGHCFVCVCVRMCAWQPLAPLAPLAEQHLQRNCMKRPKSSSGALKALPRVQNWASWTTARSHGEQRQSQRPNWSSDAVGWAESFAWHLFV